MAEEVAEKVVKKSVGKRILEGLADNKGSIILKLGWKGAIKPFLADPAKAWALGKIFPDHGPKPTHGYAPQKPEAPAPPASAPPPSPTPSASAPPAPEPSPDYKHIRAGLRITGAGSGDPPDPNITVDNEEFDRMPGRLRIAYLLGYASEVFGVETVRTLYEDLSPLVDDICGHGDDKNPEENYWGGKWQVFRAE